MKDYIYYSYNIKIIEVENTNDGYLLLDNNDIYYYFYNYDKDKNKIININTNNTMYYDILYNNNHNIINKYDNKEYVLLRIKGLININIYLKDIVNNLNKYNIEGKKTNLEKLWSKKIDYLEYQVKEFGLTKKELIDSFSFFIGLAENAISFLNINHVNYDNANLSISHNRIYYPNDSLYYYNSLNLIIDYKVRDIAEYIKEKMFYKEDITKDLEYIMNQNLTKDDLLIFYARLMFPSTYFDKVEDILLNDLEELSLDKYIDSYNDYINLLKDAYYMINKKNQILIPSWIIKEH